MSSACGPVAKRGGLPSVFKIGGALSFELILPTLVAIANGHFAAQGLAAPILASGAGTNIRTSLIAKELDFGLLAFVHTPLARQHKQALKILVSLHDREIFSLIVRSELQAHIKTVADLKGRTIGFTRPGSGAWALAQVYVSEAGLDPERDVKLVPLGDDLSVIAQSIRHGRVDAFPSWEPLTTRLISEGVAYSLVDLTDAAQHRRWIGGPVALSMTLVTTEDLIEKNPDLVQRVVKAHQLALDDLRNMSGNALATLLLADNRTAFYFLQLSPEMAARIIDRIRLGFGTGIPAKQAYDTELRLYLKTKLIAHPIDFTESVDSSFAR